MSLFVYKQSLSTACSTYLQLTDKPVCCRKWLSVTGSDALIHIFYVIFQSHQVGTAGCDEPLFLAFTNLVYTSVFRASSCKYNAMLLLQTKGPGLDHFQARLLDIDKNIHFLCSSKELSSNCPSHSYPTFSPFIPHSLSFLHPTLLLRARVGKKKTQRQQSPSIKLYFSNWLGRSRGHLGLVAG